MKNPYHHVYGKGDGHIIIIYKTMTLLEQRVLKEKKKTGENTRCGNRSFLGHELRGDAGDCQIIS